MFTKIDSSVKIRVSRGANESVTTNSPAKIRKIIQLYKSICVFLYFFTSAWTHITYIQGTYCS